MKKLVILAAAAMALATSAFAKVTTVKDAKGWRLMDNNKEVEVKGITWSQTPIGENYNYSLWKKDYNYIKRMVDTDMPLLKAMGVNVIRSFDGIPPEWVEYIYDNWGIYTIINFTMGRYGYTVNGIWHAQTNYQDAATRKTLIADSDAIIERYKDTRGVLFYMLGNESNYGLEWSSFEIENLPEGERHKEKARYLYSMFEEAMAHAHEIDPNHPIGIVNGDCQYIDLVAELCPSLDIFGTNMYRGWRFYENYYEDVQNKLDKPTVITEGGADAYNSITNREDQWAQLQYYKSQHKEIYQQAYGKGKVGNILGIFVFEWMDEWWKHWQWKNLLLHDTEPSWSNSGLSLDWREGHNNMDEEWFGIVSQSELTENGINKRVPRATYYFLQDLWTHLSLYNSTNEEIDEFFNNLPEALYLAHGVEQSVEEQANIAKKFRVSSATATVQYTAPLFVPKFIDGIKEVTKNDKTTNNNGWKSIWDAFSYANDRVGPQVAADNNGWINKVARTNPKAYTNKPTVQAETSVTIEMNPIENVTGTATIRAFTGEPFSRLKDHWYNYYTDYSNTEEQDVDGGFSVYDKEKYVDFYSASLTYEHPWFELNGYYHVGHASFEGKGDIFNLSKEAFDIIGYDTYGSKAPIAIEFNGKKALSGLSIIGGPEVWGGSAPMVLANWNKWMPSPAKGVPSFYVAFNGSADFGGSQITIFDPYRNFGGGLKASAYMDMYWEKILTVRAGALLAGTEKLNASYWSVNDGKTKKINFMDMLGAYVQVGTNLIPYVYPYVEGIYRGLVAETNPAMVRGSFYTADSGAGNRIEGHVGADIGIGPWSIKPVLRYRTPIEKAAITKSAGAYVARTLMTKEYSQGVTKSAVEMLTGSPFIVNTGNRESMEVEAVVCYDTEGGTWFHEWNSDDIENAKLAFAVTGLYQLWAGETDIIPYKDNVFMTYESPNGQKTYGQIWRDWSGPLPRQENMFQFGGRVVWNALPNWKIIGNLTVGRIGGFCTGYHLPGEPCKEHEYVNFVSAGIKTRFNHWIASGSLAFGALGPEGWYRNFNNTFPVQYSLDVAYGFGTPSFMDSLNRVGIKINGRTGDDNSSEAYGALPKDVIVSGSHYMEITGYLSIGL